MLKILTRTRLNVLAAGLLLLVIQASSALASSGKQEDRLHKQPVVSGAYAHATVPGQRVGAAYMKIFSFYGTELKRIESDAAEYVEVHHMQMREGVMRMRQIEALKLPAGKEIELAPGGVHLMLIELKKPLKAGEAVPLKIIFSGPDEKDVEVLVNAPVRPLGK
jgi:copper(I)-binding protein